MTSISNASGKLARQLLSDHLDAFKAAGGDYDDITKPLGINRNNMTQWRNGASPLPVTRIPELSRLLGLSLEESRELMATRWLELNGEKAKLSEELLAELLHMGADMGRHPVQDLWDAAASPAPGMAASFLDDPESRSRIQAALTAALQAEFAREAAEAQA